jgi:hypothetical protein
MRQRLDHLEFLVMKTNLDLFGSFVPVPFGSLFVSPATSSRMARCVVIGRLPPLGNSYLLEGSFWNLLKSSLDPWQLFSDYSLSVLVWLEVV